MRFLRALLLVASTTLAGCGGGGGDGDGSAASGSAGAPADAFTLSSTSVSFNGTQDGSAVPSQSVGVDVRSGEASYVSTSQTGEMFWHQFTDHSYNLVGHTAPVGPIEIWPQAPAEVGSFSGTITVNVCKLPYSEPCVHLAGSPKTINVGYNVLGLSITPAQLTFSSTGSNPETRTATLAATAGAASYTWQVSYSSAATDWLQVMPINGTPDLSSNGSQTLMFDVKAAGVPAGVHSATVTFSNGASFRAQMTVTLFVGDPTVNFVAPYVVPAGPGGNVIIRGRGFSALSPDTLSVHFNGTPALTAAVISDTEIRATYPPLVAGSYSISVGSGDVSIPSRTALKLIVIDPPAFPFTTISRPATAGWPQNLIYDAERQALLFVDPANNRILRYALSGSGSATLDTGEPVGDIALSPDGTELIRTSGLLTQLVRLDPATLATLSVVDTSSLRFGSQSGLGFYSKPALAFSNDGGAFAFAQRPRLALYRYDMLTRAFSPVSSRWDLEYRSIIATADGGTLFLPPLAQSAFPRRLQVYDASTGALSSRWVAPDWFELGALSASRNASRIMLLDTARDRTTVYDAEFNVLGTLPVRVGVPFVLSPDGNFAYLYSSREGRVRKFSVSAAGGLTEVGTASVVAPAQTSMSEMAISPDGGTLFLVGATSVVISPAP
jgi:hypothetical protein